MGRKNPRCFIAMAFGHDDANAVYDEMIYPILKRNKIIPIQVARRNDNRDLNIQIIEQLDNCDFCIADLTYARQSVYFEAGYAQKFVPVIYTVRSDHLESGQPDDLKVHFDLQMRPLIKWKDPSDIKFMDKLEKRIISTFLRQYKKEKKKSIELEKQKNIFKRISVLEQLRLIPNICMYYLRNNGFRFEHVDEWRKGAGFQNIYIAYRMRNGSLNIVRLYSKQRIQKTDLDHLVHYCSRLKTYKLPGLNLKKTRKYYEHNIYFSLKKENYKTIAQGLINMNYNQELERFEYMQSVSKASENEPVNKLNVRTRVSKKTQIKLLPVAEYIPCTISAYVMGPIDCETRIRDSIKKFIQCLEGNLSN